MKNLLSAAMIAAMLFSSYIVGAQGMAINTSGASADASAMLDVSSNKQGVLVPRMTATERTTSVTAPATGLLVYQTDAPTGFYFYNGASWVLLNSSTTTAGGDLTGTYPNPTLATTGVSANTYGSATAVPTIAIDAKGRITSASSTTITGVSPGGAAGGDLTGTYPNPTLATTGVSANTYGTATAVPTIAIDAKGRITSASSTTITGVVPGGSASGDLTGTYPGPTIGATPATGTRIVTAINASSSTLNVANLPGSGVSATTYGDATHVPAITVDAKGRITAATLIPITTGAGTLGGGVSTFTLSNVTTLQAFTISTSGGSVGATNRLFCFDLANNSYWVSNQSQISVDLGAASLYPAGTVLNFMQLNGPYPTGFNIKIKFISSGSSFTGPSNFHVSSSPSGFIGSANTRLMSDGASKWYLL